MNLWKVGFWCNLPALIIWWVLLGITVTLAQVPVTFDMISGIVFYCAFFTTITVVCHRQARRLEIIRTLKSYSGLYDTTKVDIYNENNKS